MRDPRWCRVPLILAALAAGSPGLRAEDGPQSSRSGLDVLLTTAPTLPNSSRTWMMTEAAGIWRAQNVDINWRSPELSLPVASSRLRVLVVERQSRVKNPGDAFAVGELVRPSTAHPVALLSIEGARRLVRSVRGRLGPELTVIDEQRLGVVLGRALAHEIGHYLLRTQTHARTGLMRPHFSALEFTDMRDGLFALDRDASVWLRARGADTFAYAR